MKYARNSKIKVGKLRKKTLPVGNSQSRSSLSFAKSSFAEKSSLIIPDEILEKSQGLKMHKNFGALRRVKYRCSNLYRLSMTDE
uniref:Uncharacterized protein n=1 Tax=Romanomermis culicivorax TaxID=13658 RepID=A0A915I9R3_ROMCU